MTIETYSFKWQGITIDIKHDDAWTVIKDLDVHIQHLEVQRRDEGQLPVTSTGYRSAFLTDYQDFFLLKQKGVVNFVRDWIDLEGQSKEWKSYVEAFKQFDLFG